MERYWRCDHHQQLVEGYGGENYKLTKEVRGPVANVYEEGKQMSRFPDGCPGAYSAHYSLYYGRDYIADTSGPHQAGLFREIALRLNEEK